MSAVTIAIRLVPLTLIRGQVKNRFVRSFLYYVPYVTLAVMTFPAILTATQTPVSGALAFVIGIALAWYGACSKSRRPAASSSSPSSSYSADPAARNDGLPVRHFPRLSSMAA